MLRHTSAAVRSVRFAGPIVVAAVALWMTPGTLTTVGPSAAQRAAVLPPLWTLPLAFGAVASLLWMLRRRGVPSALWLAILLWLPWLPLAVLPAFLIWTGSLAVLVWVAVLIGVWLESASGPSSSPRSSWLTETRRATLLAGLLSLAVYGVCAWRVLPSLPAGDEPHYLVITQSLLSDHDLRIENNHQRRDYESYYAGDLPMHYLKTGANGQVYSVHSPGLPALILPAFAIGGYRGVVAFLIALAAAGAALGWWLAWRVTASAGAAWFGWAAVSLSTTAVFHSFTVFPDGVAGLLVLAGTWGALQSHWDAQPDRDGLKTPGWLLPGAALAFLPWLHIRLTPIAVVLGAVTVIALARPTGGRRNVLVFLLPPAASAIAWLLFFRLVYGTFSPLAAYGSESDSSLRYIWQGLSGMLFDQRFGLLIYAPVLIVALGGLLIAGRAGVYWLLMAVPYLAAVTSVAMWWGGWSPPGRFFAPLLPSLVVPAACAWTRIKSQVTRAATLSMLVVSIGTSLLLTHINEGRLAFNVRQQPALFFRWLQPTVDLSLVVPDFLTVGSHGFMKVAIWIAAFLLAWIVVRSVALRAASEIGRAWTLTWLAGAIVVMVISSLEWRLSSVPPASGQSQLRVLQAAARHPSWIGLTLQPARWRRADSFVSVLRIEADRVWQSEAADGVEPHDFAVTELPAGSYRLTNEEDKSAIVELVVARSAQPIFKGRLDRDHTSQIIDLPVKISAAVIRSSGDIRKIYLTPISISHPRERPSEGTAIGAADYGDVQMYFFDRNAYPERDGLWTRGGRSTEIVVRPRVPRPSVTLIVRNGPLRNAVSVTGSNWRRDFDLAAEAEVALEVPIEAAIRAGRLLVESSAAFVPAEIEKGSQDYRPLGVYLRLGS